MDEQPPLTRGTSAEVVARAVREDLESGVYRHGQQLPSTRTLAEQWSTSVATITRAMQLLADEGLIVSRDRSSRVANLPDPSASAAALSDAGMSSAEHFARAEALLEEVDEARTLPGSGGHELRVELLARAQVHATLALAQRGRP